VLRGPQSRRKLRASIFLLQQLNRKKGSLPRTISEYEKGLREGSKPQKQQNPAFNIRGEKEKNGFPGGAGGGGHTAKEKRGGYKSRELPNYRGVTSACKKNHVIEKKKTCQ